jgi:D-alanyl-D-alanine carboxypeptidase (penicillin-binding protein 5/6)
MCRTCSRGAVLVCLLLSLVLTVTLSLRLGAEEMPHPFAVAARSAVLMDANSGQFIYGQNPHERINPASFVKVLTLFLIFDAIERGQVHLDDKVWISKKAWQTGGSKMFVRVGDRLPLDEIIKGIAVVSGNDACVAAAEFLQGSEEAFVFKMNEKLHELGIQDTRFQTVNGWPAPDQYTTAADMALLARAYIQAHPEALKYHQMKEFTHEGIRQTNRNGLLWRDPSVDGLKTGHVEEAGYHLLATAKRGDQRLIAVVMDTKNDSVREREALRLLTFGFRNFASVSLFDKGKVLLQVPVWKGTVGQVDLVAAEPGVITVPITQKDDISWQAKAPDRLMAPIQKGQTLGQAVILAKDRELKSISLIADRQISLAGFFKRTLHSLALLSADRGKLLIAILVLLVTLAGAFWFLTKHRPRRAQRP